MMKQGVLHLSNYRVSFMPYDPKDAVRAYCLLRDSNELLI